MFFLKHAVLFFERLGFVICREYVSIYIDGSYIGTCEPLNEDCSFDLINCTDFMKRNISQFMDETSPFQNITIYIDSSDQVNFCPSNGSYLIAFVTIGCTYSGPASDQCQVNGNLQTVDWNNLLFESDNDGISPIVNFDGFVDDNTIGIEINVTSDYIVSSKYDLLEQYYKSIYGDTPHNGKLPVTYLITFEEFENFEERQLNAPGSCDNRRASSYSGFNTTMDYVYQYWTFTLNPGLSNNLGNDDYMEYPDSNVWSISFDESNNTNRKCGTVTWSAQFDLADMLNINDNGCYDSNGDSSFQLVDDTQNDILSLQGTLYLYMVSPDPVLLADMDTKSFDELQTSFLHHAIVSLGVSLDFNKGVCFLCIILFHECKKTNFHDKPKINLCEVELQFSGVVCLLPVR